MSLVFPNTKAEFTASSGLLAAFLIGPLILLAIFFWRAYFSIEAHVWSVEIGAVLSIPTFILLVYRTRHLTLKGFNPYGAMGSLKNYVALLVVCFFCLYGWTLVLWVAIPLLKSGNTQTLSFNVAEMSECTGKCALCRYRVRPDNWFGVSTSNLCVTRETWNSLCIGDRIQVEAYSSTHSLYVVGVRRG
jgi:hypothetical protein